MSSCPYEIGDRFRFKPAPYVDSPKGFGAMLDVKVLGTVTQIHEAHRWYRVSYETPCGVQYECFKF